MLKIIIPPKKLIFKWLRVDNSEVGRFNNSDDEKITRKLRKLKNEKLFKSQKLAKSRKKLSKSGNLFKFSAKKTKPSISTFHTRKAFNYL